MSECSSEKCCCPCHSKQGSCESMQNSCQEENGEGMGHFFLDVADEAWTEVLKDKIKEHILATQNDRMTELAKIVSEANSNRWRHKMEKNKCCMDFKEKLCSFFEKGKK